jgi:hypothetical protein
MSNILSPDIEYVVNEKVDIVFEPILFTNITTKNIGKNKVKDILPLVDYVKADLQLRRHVSSGINKKIYYSEVEKELKKLIQCN